ncbi:MAG: hypothetical protein WKF68_00635 [Daejeonella sp.]
MEHNRFKKVTLLAFSFLLTQVAFAQSDSKAHKHNTIRIDTRDLSNEISNIFKTVALEIKKIDFEKVGVAIEAAVNEIECEVGDIEVIINDRHRTGLPEQQDELIGTEEKTRIISKTYSVDGNDKLAISNQYGKVAVHTWAKNEIKVDVEIKAFESTENDAQNLLESVTITDTRQGDLINFKTSFGKTSMNFWSKVRNGKEERRGVQVNYVVYMPSKNPLDINNQYGGIILPDFSGPVNINSSYGGFSGGKLDNPANQVKVSYGTASLEDYSNGNLTVSYGTLNLASASKVNATVKYSGARITKLTSGGTFDLSYSGGFKIDNVDKNVKNLVINSSYSGVTLGIDENADFDFDVTVSYAGFNYNNDKINLVNQLSDAGKTKVWNPTKNYKGSMGKGSDSRIIIKSSYGAVKFM